MTACIGCGAGVPSIVVVVSIAVVDESSRMSRRGVGDRRGRRPEREDEGWSMTQEDGSREMFGPRRWTWKRRQNQE